MPQGCDRCDLWWRDGQPIDPDIHEVVFSRVASVFEIVEVAREMLCVYCRNLLTQKFIEGWGR